MAAESYNGAEEFKQFDESKVGVKGLVDSGFATIPRFFIHPPQTLSKLRTKSNTKPDPDIIPTVDLSGVDSDLLRPTIVEKIARASRELGFFQVVNHGIGVEVLERVIGAVKGFHEQPAEIKARVYGRDLSRGVLFSCNNDFFYGKAASWRDTLRIRLSPILPKLDEIPEICRNEVVKWDQNMKQLGELLMGLLCEGLGLKTGKLKELSFLECRLMAVQYYPYCPQPDLTLGIMSHSDPVALTILLQNQMGGLQVMYDEEWMDVKPLSGALVINIGDMLQIMSNDEYRSVKHRELANPFQEPRVSTVVVFTPSEINSLYGPFPEIVSPEKPSRFQTFTFADYIRRFSSQDLDGKSLVNYYRISE